MQSGFLFTKREVIAIFALYNIIMEDNSGNTSGFIFYTSADGTSKINVIIDDENETVWLSQNGMADIFGVVKSTISEHLSNIYESEELTRKATVRKIRTVQKEGSRNVSRELDFYNLDAIISVGYRVNSQKATQFRIWATSILKEYLIKGFAMDDDRLKQGKALFDKDYFDELLERIREIRASERRFYQKITDLYATAVDYDATASVTQTFFKTVQNKLEFAITKHTASELIKSRANSNMPNMGLTTWKNSGSGGKILKSDVGVAKNYLSESEISELNTLVTMYLDYAELQAKRNQLMTMENWIQKIDAFLMFNDYDILKDAGTIKAEVAKRFAEDEFQKFRVTQDIEYRSDFDKTIEQIKSTGSLPKRN